jgi:AcrR family transcriptional regulator
MKASERASTRREPKQQRSRQTVEAVLEAVQRVLRRQGAEAITTNRVAEAAGVSIGSLYQYFPDKSAIIRTLAERYNAVSRKCIEGALAGVRDLNGLLEAFASLVDQYYAIFLAEPVMRDIWSGMQADKELMAIELAESRASGALLAAVMRRVHPSADPEKTAASALLIWQLGEATMRLAISLDRSEGDAIVDAYKRMTLRELAEV